MISSSLKVLQVNLNRSATATESALQLATELKIDLLVVQEPWITPKNQEQEDYSNARSIAHPSFTQILPADLRFRPRTLVYVAIGCKPIVTIASSSPKDPDLLAIDITEGNSKAQLLNIYNEIDQAGTGLNTLQRCLYNRELQPSTILAGDFNTHHRWWDPLARPSSGADELVEWLESQELALLNTPGTGTFYRPNLARESVLDLTLATSSLASRIQDWQVLQEVGSDHYGLLFSITGTQASLVENPLLQAKFNTSLADWSLFATSLKANSAKSPILSALHLLEPIGTTPETTISNLLLKGELDFSNFFRKIPDTDFFKNPRLKITDFFDIAATELTSAITSAAKASIPTSRPGARAKPWWNPELLELRKTMLREQRGIGLATNPSGKLAYLQARNTYFSAIKQAKKDHWNQFLENEDPKSIFKALAYTKNRLVEKIPSILNKDSF